MRTINCHDCGRPVSLNARQCPLCGSTTPAGPYKSKVPFRIEERNDRRFIVLTVAAGIIGAFYGIEKSSTLGAFLIGPVYGFLGAAIGASLAFALNLTRNWR